MRDTLALLTAGVGIFFLGLDLVSRTLQESTSRTLRSLIRHSTKSLSSCAALGIVGGAIMQSTSAVATVLGSMAATGMISLRQALPIVAFANVGTTILVFAGAFDIRLAVLFALGIGGVSSSLLQEFRWKALATVALGIALLLYGGNLVAGAASDIERAGWLSMFLQSWYGSSAMGFALGVMASFIAQSTTAVALMTVALASARLLDPGEAIAMIYGANLGSTLMRILLTQRSTGTLRQVSRFQDLFKIAGTAIFVGLFAVERFAHVPLVEALVERTMSHLPLQLAAVNLIFNGSMALLAAAFAKPIEQFVARTWPPSSVENLSVPKYAVHEAIGDAATAIDLLEKEQMRVLKRTRDYLAPIRPHAPDPGKADAASLHRSFATLFREMEHFYVALISKHLDDTTSQRLGNVHGREKLLELIEDSMYQLATSVAAGPKSAKLNPLVENFTEALDFLLMFTGDATRTLDRERAEFVFELSSDRGEMMAGIRVMYFAPDQALTAPERALLLRLTSVFERIVWMVQRYAELLLKNVETVSQ